MSVLEPGADFPSVQGRGAWRVQLSRRQLLEQLRSLSSQWSWSGGRPPAVVPVKTSIMIQESFAYTYMTTSSGASQDNYYDSRKFCRHHTLEGLSWVPLVFTQTPIERVASRMRRCSRDWGQKSAVQTFKGQWMTQSWVHIWTSRIYIRAVFNTDFRSLPEQWAHLRQYLFWIKITWARLRQPTSGWSRLTLPKSASFTRRKLKSKFYVGHTFHNTM